MPPKRTAAGNGLEILGWAKASRMILVKTEEWQNGSDAPDTQQALAIDIETGLIYEPELQAMLQTRKDKQCSFRVADAGFSAEKNIDILVRAKFSTQSKQIKPNKTFLRQSAVRMPKKPGASISLQEKYGR